MAKSWHSLSTFWHDMSAASLAVALLGAEQAVNQVVANGERERLEQLAGNQVVLRPGKRVMNVPQNGLAQRFGIERYSGQQISGHS